MVSAKINFIDDKMDHSINKLVVYFAYPCLIVHNIGELDLTADVPWRISGSLSC